MSTATGSRFLTPKELADEIGVSKSTLARWRAEGLGPPPTQAGPKTVLYERSGVERWIAKHTREMEGSNGWT